MSETFQIGKGLRGSVVRVWEKSDSVETEMLLTLETLLALVRCGIKGALLEVAMSDAEKVINKARGGA